MVTLVKLGGSLITDKTQKATLRSDVLNRIVSEIKLALVQKPDLSLVLGHGSGSFGHFEAKQYDTMQGVNATEQWRGFAKVASIAAELNYYVASAMQSVDIPVMRFQPSASAIADNGVIRAMALQNIEQALQIGLVPLVYGDVAFDVSRGGTIVSTETVFTYIVQHLSITVDRVILVGEVDGVYDAKNKVITRITPANFASIQSALGQSAGVDVTGGMLTKVQDMLILATQPPYPTIQIINGLSPNLLAEVLSEQREVGTIITRS